jgi:hypothetical protein
MSICGGRSVDAKARRNDNCSQLRRGRSCVIVAHRHLSGGKRYLNILDAEDLIERQRKLDGTATALHPGNIHGLGLHRHTTGGPDVSSMISFADGN